MNGPLDGENCIQTTEAKSCTRDHPYIALAYGLVVSWVQKISLSADIQYCIYVLVTKKNRLWYRYPNWPLFLFPICTKTWFRSHTSWNEQDFPYWAGAHNWAYVPIFKFTCLWQRRSQGLVSLVITYTLIIAFEYWLRCEISGFCLLSLPQNERT